MKKLIFALALTLIAAGQAFAQADAAAQAFARTDAEPQAADTPFALRAGAAYFPSVPTLVSIFGAFFRAVTLKENERIKMNILPCFSLEGQYSLSKRISVGIDLAYAHSFYTVYDKTTGDTVKEDLHLSYLGIMPEFRYNYLIRKNFRLYGIAQAGLLLDLAAGADAKKVFGNFEVVPIGMEFGGRLFGFFELGAGLSYSGVRAGAGWRF